MAEEMVMVGCKHPNGVVLNLDRYETMGTNGAVRLVSGKRAITLKGWAHQFNRPDPTEESGGYALTSVPKAFWDQWLADHEGFPMLVDKTILGPHRDGQGQSRAHASVPKMHAPSDGELKAVQYVSAD